MTRTLALFASVLLICSTSLFSQESVQMSTQELVFPQLAVGGGWESELTIIAQGADTSTGVVFFFAQDGSSMAVNVDGGAAATYVPYSLLYRSSQTFRLTSSGTTRVGWIAVSQALPANTERGSIGGVLTYRYFSGGRLISQVGVLPSQAVAATHMAFDNTNGNLTVMALTSFVANSITLTRYNEEGTFLESKSIDLSATAQRALYIYQLFPGSANSRGFLTISGTSPFNLLTLNGGGDTWSSSAAMAAVYEREVQLVIGDTTQWTFRLIRNGQYLYGIADRTDPEPLTTFAVTGAFVGDPSQQTLHLNLHFQLTGTNEGVTLTLIAKVPDTRLLSVRGNVVGVKDDGSIWTTGTFEMYPWSMAQF